MKKTLYLMRHGQTLFNVRGKIQGWCDSPLTEVGIKQAQIAANYFKERNITFDAAYSSTSERASDTLELITDTPYKRLKGLKEWNFGTFEGESGDLNPPLPYLDFFKTYAEGEGEDEAQNRVSNCIADFMNQDNHGTVLAVSHGGSCALFYQEWEKHAKVKREPGCMGNCTIFKYEYENGIFTLLEIYNHDFNNL